MGFRVLVATVALCVLVPAAAGSGPRADKNLDQALRQLVRTPGGPPGVVAVVQRGSRRIVFKHGVARRTPRKALSLGARWRIASVSKAFSGAVALALVARGRLGLDDTIHERLPSLPSAWGNVTLANLLQHTSGLRDYTATTGFQAQVEAHPLDSVQPATLLSWLGNRPLQFTPGSRYHYSNTDNIVVALFVQAASGLSYEQALRRYVFAPLGLHRTSMPTGVRMPLPFVHGYGGNEDVSEALNPTLAWASGGLVSTPVDLTRFVRAYAGGRLFGGATRAAQLRFRAGQSEPAGPGTNAVGLGVFRYHTSCGTMYGHTGNYLGYTAFIASSRDGRRSITIQASTQLSRGTGDQRAFQALERAFSLGVCAAFA